VNALDKTLAIVEAALEKKSYDLVVLRIEHLATIADYFVIMSGRSAVQVAAIAQGIEDRLRNMGVAPLSVEGLGPARWVVLDYGDVVLHIFYEPVRELYRLESIWSDAANVTLPEPLRSQAAQLRLREHS
jgi:ribosome-associated protein